MKNFPSGELRIYSDAAQFVRAAAELFVDRAAKAIQARGRFRVALTGGHTPIQTYKLLATTDFSTRVDWEHVDLFWGDERYVPPEDPENNYHMSAETLLRHVPVPAANLHRVRTEISPPAASASDYEARILQSFGEPASLPQFDLIYLGLGTNGHVASLFPHSPALRETSRLVVADLASEVSTWRISMTFPLLNNARTVAFLVRDREKAQIVRDVLFGPRNPEHLPAQYIAPTGELLWLLDQEAAALLPDTSRERRSA